MWRQEVVEAVTVKAVTVVKSPVLQLLSHVLVQCS